MLLIGQLAWITETSAQNIAINGTGSLPDTSAMLDVSSSNKGFLAPRMTSTEQNAIPLPANGLLIYNTTENAFKVNTGTAASPVWTSLATGITGATTNTLGSSVNTMTSTTNGVAATAPIVNTIGNTSSTNTLTTTVNGIAATGVSIINSNALTNPANTITSSVNGITSTAPAVNTTALSLSGSTLTSTVNGVASSGLNLTPAITAAITNTLSRATNIMTNTTNGVAATASIVNSNALSLSGTNLTSTVNGVSSTALNLSPIFATSVWTLKGNTGITQPATPATYGTSTIGSSENFLGTTDAKDLVLATNNIEKMRLVNSTGYFGIGTAAPAKPLDIVKNLANEGLMKLQNTNAAGYSSIDIWSATQQIGNIGFSNGGVSYANAFYFATNTTNSMVLATNNTERLRIDGTNGNIGLGVAAPTAVLHMEAGTATAGTAPLKFTAGTNLSTVENGAVEYDGTNYFGTTGGVRYTLAKTLSASDNLNFPSTSSGSSSDETISVAGAQTGDVVSLGIPASAVVSKGEYMAYVSTAGVVTVRFTNYSTSTINPSPGSFRVAVLRY